MKKQKVEVEQKKISQLLKEYVDNGHSLSTVGGKFTGEDFNDILSVLNETVDNFCIFDNGGGRPFQIWFYNAINWKLEEFENWIKKDIGYMYMYKINGKETVVSDLPRY